MLTKCDAICSLTLGSVEYAKQLFNKKFINKKFYLIPHPHYINGQQILENKRNEYGIKDNEICFLISGGLARPGKRVYTVVKAFIDANIENAKLIIYGHFQIDNKIFSNIIYNRIKSLVKNKKNIIFIKKEHGFSDEENIIIHNTSDICVFPY
jgi:hypothetical protein